MTLRLPVTILSVIGLSLQVALAREKVAKTAGFRDTAVALKTQNKSVQQIEGDGIVKTILLPSNERLSQNRDRKTISLNIQFVEVPNSFNAPIRFGGLPEDLNHSEPTVTYGLISNIFPKLKWATKREIARVLDSIDILVPEGQIAYFHSDVEDQPHCRDVREPSSKKNTLYGIEGALTVLQKPNENPQGTKLHLNFNVRLPARNALNFKDRAAVPAPLPTQKIELEYGVRTGQSVAVSFKEPRKSISRSSASFEQSDDRLLSSLIHSKKYQDGKTHLAVIVTLEPQKLPKTETK